MPPCHLLIGILFPNICIMFSSNGTFMCRLLIPCALNHPHTITDSGFLNCVLIKSVLPTERSIHPFKNSHFNSTHLRTDSLLVHYQMISCQEKVILVSQSGLYINFVFALQFQFAFVDVATNCGCRQWIWEPHAVLATTDSCLFSMQCLLMMSILQFYVEKHYFSIVALSNIVVFDKVKPPNFTSERL